MHIHACKKTFKNKYFKNCKLKTYLIEKMFQIVYHETLKHECYM